MLNVALDILVNVVKTKILLIFISFSSLVFIFVLVLVSSTIIQNVFIFVIVFVVVDEKNTAEDVSLVSFIGFEVVSCVLICLATLGIVVQVHPR